MSLSLVDAILRIYPIRAVWRNPEKRAHFSVFLAIVAPVAGCARLEPGFVGCGMKLYRVDKLAKRGGVVIKKKHILAPSDRAAVKQAEESSDCPICEVKRDGETVGQIL
jgi:hypothetical protein